MIDLNCFRKLAARPRVGCFPVLFLLAGWLALVTPLRADNPPTYVFQIGSPAMPGGFIPYGLVLDSSNNVYVSDNVGNDYDRIIEFDSNGTYLTQWGSYGSGNGQFIDPAGIAVDSRNNVYVADDYRIETFDSNGTFLSQFGSSGSGNGQFYYPYGVAVDTSNNVYVTDLNNENVTKFSRNGTYLMQWGTLGSGNGQFFRPSGIALDSSNKVYVADANNNRVEKFDSNGNYLMQWGSLGSGNGQFDGPVGIAVDRSNNVYVTDVGNYRVEKFDGNGNYLTQWGGSGRGNGQFDDPQGVAVESSGNFIYVADSGNHRIQVFVNDTNRIPPFITQQPASQTVPAGTDVSFSVSVVGGASLACQWTSNNVALPGATNVTFTLTNVSLSASGTYSVLVTNNFGGESSSHAVLAVLPALVTTLPASGISASGAVLNGSLTVGPDETVAWFDWGTDTNYANIEGATIVPGNNGSSNISAALSGLSGNFYHCRIVAANDFGIVYGSDQLFTVGFPPTATTLAPVNSTNGSTLIGLVNPNGWETTVYFQWGLETSTNSTPGMDIGAGTTSLTVSNFVTGLALLTPYHYQVVASNALGTVSGGIYPPLFTVSVEPLSPTVAQYTVFNHSLSSYITTVVIATPVGTQPFPASPTMVGNGFVSESLNPRAWNSPLPYLFSSIPYTWNIFTHLPEWVFLPTGIGDGYFSLAEVGDSGDGPVFVGGSIGPGDSATFLGAAGGFLISLMGLGVPPGPDVPVYEQRYFGTATIVPPPPQLTINLSGANAILSWPTNFAGFTLEWATNLVSPVAWNANLWNYDGSITNLTVPVVIAGQNVVTNPISGTQMFYRLASARNFGMDWRGLEHAMAAAGAISYGRQPIYGASATTYDMFYLPVPTYVTELANANPTLCIAAICGASGEPGYGCGNQWQGLNAPLDSIGVGVIVMVQTAGPAGCGGYGVFYEVW